MASSEPFVTTIPSKMQAIVQTGYDEKDPSNVVTQTELDVPVPGPKDVLVKVYAASLNAADWKIAAGFMSLVIKLKFPYIIGRDFSGVVVATGAKVKGIQVGARVAGQIKDGAKRGTFSEYIAIAPEMLQRVPSSLDLNDAAAFGMAGQTAYEAVLIKGKLLQNHKVLILGGSTACGAYGIQLAKAMNASEIVVTSSQKEFCTNLGATRVYNYKEEKESDYWSDMVSKGDKFDLIYDTVGGADVWKKAHKLLNDESGQFVTLCGDVAHGKLTFGKIFGMIGGTMKHKWSTKNKQSYSMINAKPHLYLKEMLELCQQKKIRPLLDQDGPFALKDFKIALQKSMKNKAHGKLVIVFANENDENEKNEKNEKNETENEKKNEDAAPTETTETTEATEATTGAVAETSNAVEEQNKESQADPAETADATDAVDAVAESGADENLGQAKDDEQVEEPQQVPDMQDVQDTQQVEQVPQDQPEQQARQEEELAQEKEPQVNAQGDAEDAQNEQNEQNEDDATEKIVEQEQEAEQVPDKE